MRYEVKDRWDGKILYADEAASFKALIAAAVRAKANLYGANLVRANLVRANLDGANLYGANLVRANLDGANLYGANLDGANLYGANLYGANLDGATGIHGFFCFGPGGSRKSYTWARWEPKGYIVHCGCQTLTIKNFTKAVKEKHGDNEHGKYYMAMIGAMNLIAVASKEAFDAAEVGRKAKAAA